MIIAFISYLLEWKADDSILSESDYTVFNNETKNQIGGLGAKISHQMIKLWFGISAMLIPFITLLIGANEPGLEVNDKSGKWIPVSSSYEDIVCNIGDMMQLITDHNLKSTPHRVVKYKTDEIKSRYSIPFFMHPSPGTILKSVFNDNDSGVLAHDFLDERLRAIKLY